jgi:hypothetical protein
MAKKQYFLPELSAKPLKTILPSQNVALFSALQLQLTDHRATDALGIDPSFPSLHRDTTCAKSLRDLELFEAVYQQD